MKPLYIHGIGVVGPGLDGWRQTAAALVSDKDYTAAPMQAPVPSMLKANERRRTTATIRLALQAAEQAVAETGVSATGLATVFSSADGDMEIADRICRALTLPEKPVSPTHFHNSVHNAPAGYWSIAAATQMPSTTLAVYAASFSSGLLEAAVQSETTGEPVLIVAYENPPPHPLSLFEPITEPFSIAMVLDLEPSEYFSASLVLSLTGDGQLDTMQSPALERLRLGNPAARCLPLLRLLASKETSSVCLPYIWGCNIRIKVEHLMIDHTAICGLIPHAGSMCLLDSVAYWDNESIICHASSHQNVENPLYGNDGLSAVHALEYGAQAVALHGGLCTRKQGAEMPQGYIAAIRDAVFYQERLDRLPHLLQIEVRQLLVAGGDMIYELRVSTQEVKVAEARLTIMNRCGP